MIEHKLSRGFALALLAVPALISVAQAAPFPVSVQSMPPVTGTVGISGTPNVTVTNTVPVTGSVGIAGTPNVTVTNTVPVTGTVGIAGTPAVTVTNTVPVSGAVGITGTANVNVTNTAPLPVSGSVVVSGPVSVNVATLPAVTVDTATPLAVTSKDYSRPFVSPFYITSGDDGWSVVQFLMYVPNPMMMESIQMACLGGVASAHVQIDNYAWVVGPNPVVLSTAVQPNTQLSNGGSIPALEFPLLTPPIAPYYRQYDSYLPVTQVNMPVYSWIYVALSFTSVTTPTNRPSCAGNVVFRNLQ